MRILILALSLGVSWGLALAFLRADWKRAIPLALIPVLSAAALGALLALLGQTGLDLIVQAAASLLGAVLLPVLLHRPWRDVLTAFLLAQGAGVLLYSVAGEPVLFAVLLVLSVCLTLWMARWFPQPGWRELPEGSQDRFSVWQVDVLLVLLCLIVYAAALMPAAGAMRWFASLLTAAAWWLGLGLVLALLAGRQARLAAASEKQYRAEMETFMNVIRSQRHDYNFHVRTLAGLVRKGDLGACRAYVEELVQDSNEMNELLPIRDPAISATIFSFRALAAREGTPMHIDVQNDLSHISTNVYETNKIISNLLQNAIDEVSTHLDKSYGIWLYILKRGQFCVIHTANELQGPITEDSALFQQGYTTKQGHEGVGLSSVRSLAERNHGQVYTRLEDNVIHIIAKVPLRYQASDEDRYRRDE